MISTFDIRAAINHHQRGELVQAETLYRKILEIDPDNADALHMLGVLAAQMGHLAPAIDLIQRAIKRKPDNLEAYANLGKLQIDSGLPEAAVESYRRVVSTRPFDAVGWYSLGISYRLAGRSQEAIQAFESATKYRADFADAYIELGNQLRSAGDLLGAHRAHSKAIELNPSSGSARNNLANVLVKMGKMEEAIKEYQLAINLDPSSPSFRSNLGDAFRRQGVHAAAMAAYDSAIQISPNHIPAISGRAAVFADVERFEESLVEHDRAIALSPDDPKVYEAKGDTFFVMRSLDEAERCFSRALEISPTSASALSGLGLVKRSVGKFHEAEQLFRKAIEIDPTDVMAFKNLVSISKDSIHSGVEQVARLLDSRLSVEDEVGARFALGKSLDDADRFDEAFVQYDSANALWKDHRANLGDRFDPRKLHDNVDLLIHHFSAEYFINRHDGARSDLPIFIVGMPRSGTSLVEQIVASHSEVFGAGELNEVSNYAEALGPDPTKWNAEVIAKQAAQHLDFLRKLSPDRRNVVDKMPGNILHLGLIATLFPKAKVIFCNREPLDNCLSCYFQWFAKNHLMFSYDLQHCAAQYLEQRRLHAHWQRVLPCPMLNVQYEDLVTELESQAQRLISFIGLKWQQSCLEFYKTSRTVLTASVWQVRQPIYSSSVGRWRHYEKHLGPLISALGMSAGG